MVKLKIAGISFDHMHMGDLLRMVHENPDAELTGIFDPDASKMTSAIATFNIPADRVFTDFDACMTKAKPDLAILCAATADHARYTERLAKYGVHVFVEKPFATSVADARAMIAAMRPTGKVMAINWPLAWVESHLTAKRLIDEGVIGELREVNFTMAIAARSSISLTRLRFRRKKSNDRSRHPGGTSAHLAAAVC